MITCLPCLAKEGEMTDQELHEVFEENLPIVKSHLNFYAEGDMDHVQNGLTNMYASIVTNNEKNKKRKEKKSLNSRFLKNAIRWGIICEARRGCSVDSNIKSFKRRNLDIEIVKTDALEQEVADFILTDKVLPLDLKVISKISWERFFKSLTWLERRFVKARLEELTTIEIYIKLKIGQYQYLRMRRSALAKFQTAFS